MQHPNSQVVVAYDFSKSGREALYRGLALAIRAPFHVLHFVNVIDGHGTYDDAARIQQEIADLVTVELRASKAENRIHFFVHARIGKPAEEILNLAREVGADLIVVGTKGLTGVERLVLGSVAEKVVREAGCTVQVARAKTYDHVELLEIKTVEHHDHYVKPHRYSYESSQVQLRPANWPLY